MSSKRLLIVAGGTGGHVMPGLAVAHYLMAQGWQVRWLGTADRMEAQLVPQQGIDIDFIHISGLRGKGMKALISAPMQIARAIYQARRSIRAWQPDVVLGMGGYVAGPGGLAAWLCRVPLAIHEQNGVAGLTNRWLAKIADKVMQAFPGTFPQQLVTGNPLRAEVLALPTPAERYTGRTGPLRLLVLGGSQGARVLNRLLPAVAERLAMPLTLWHQTGKGALAEVTAAYAAIEQVHKVTEFIDDIAAALAWADVIICRSGALTVSEVAAAGLPAIFIPFPHQDRQQYWNARWLAQAGAAKIIEQSQLNPEVVVETLTQWRDRRMLLTLADKARQIAIPDATARVAAEIERLAKGRYVAPTETQ